MGYRKNSTKEEFNRFSQKPFINGYGCRQSFKQITAAYIWRRGARTTLAQLKARKKQNPKQLPLSSPVND